MHQFIQVRYPNNRRGSVDDITLDELIRSQRITRFYRPTEQSWVNIFVDPVRGRGDAKVARGLRRRTSDREEDNQQEEREENSGGLFRKVFKRREKRPPGKALSAQECFERGFAALRITNDYAGAARAFALSIQLSPMHQQAYVNRGLAYEQLGNVQQAIGDYSAAILLDPDEGRPYYFRGLAFKRLGMVTEATADLRRAADLRYRPASDWLASQGILSP
jgi:tetratricopeptide (TPR) repeat protein